MNLSTSESTPILLIIVCVLLITFQISSYLFNLQTARNLIREDLANQGATNIEIAHEWLDFDRETLTFSVTYTDQAGREQSRRCKLRCRIVVDNEIFWAEPEYATEIQMIDNPRSEMLRTQTDKLLTDRIIKALPIPDSADQIIMLDYTRSFQNVLRRRVDGSVVWQAELPTNSGDAYTNIQWTGHNLTAFSKSCTIVILDVETGKIILPKPHEEN